MAARAAVVPEVADIRGRVVVGRPTGAAVLRVGGVGEALTRNRRIVDPEPERLGATARDVGKLMPVAASSALFGQGRAYFS